MDKPKLKRAERDFDDFGEGAISSSSSSLSSASSVSRSKRPNFQGPKGSKSNHDEKDAQKRVRVQEEAAEEEEEEEEEEKEEAPMNNLPTEMLLKILEHLDSWSLRKCRFVNRRWRALSTGILCQRLQISFTFENGTFFRPIKQKRRSLKDFLDCMKNSKDCPFAHFTFSVKLGAGEPSTFFNHEDWTQFLSDFKNVYAEDLTIETTTTTEEKIKMKRLELIFWNVDNENHVASLAEDLRALFSTTIAQIEEFYLTFERETSAGVAEVRLPVFSQPKPREKNSQSVSVFQSSIKPIRLKEIKLQSSAFSRYPGIVADLLSAASSLQKMYIHHKSPEFTIDMFRLLHSLRKVGLLQDVLFRITPQLLSDMKNIRQQEQQQQHPAQLFKLQKLFLKLEVNKEDWDYCRETSIFLSHLLESSKDTLTQLGMPPLEFLQSSGFGFPTSKLKKLRSLHVFSSADSEAGSSDPVVFPVGVRKLDLFPAVSKLELDVEDWVSAFPREDFIPRLPSVKLLEIDDSYVDHPAISMLPLLCPNLKALQIQRSGLAPELSLLEVGREIWTHLITLESLELDLALDLPENNPLALDSCFTGISLENCQRLVEVMEAKKTLEKYGISVIVSQWDSKLDLMAEREHPSILDMTQLKTLKINAYSGETLLDKIDFFTEKLSWISEEYAFKSLPHLKRAGEEELELV